PTAVNAIGFAIAAFENDSLVPFTWKLYSATGSNVGEGSEEGGSALTNGFLGVLSTVPFKSLTVSRMIIGPVLAEFSIDDFRYVSVSTPIPPATFSMPFSIVDRGGMSLLSSGTS